MHESRRAPKATSVVVQAVSDPGHGRWVSSFPSRPYQGPHPLYPLFPSTYDVR